MFQEWTLKSKLRNKIKIINFNCSWAEDINFVDGSDLPCIYFYSRRKSCRDLLVWIGVIVLCGEASHKVTVVATHHLLHMLEMMGWRWTFRSSQRSGIRWRSWMTRRRWSHASWWRGIIVGCESFRFYLQPKFKQQFFLDTCKCCSRLKKLRTINLNEKLSRTSGEL